VSLLPLLACEDPLKPAQRIDEPRVLGVRLTSASGAAGLTPGEPGQIEVLLAGPEGPVSASVAYRVCSAVETQRGVPTCAEPALAEGLIAPPMSSGDFDVPESLEPGTALAVLGVACRSGEPLLEQAPLDWRCSDGSEPRRFSFDASVNSDAANLPPDLAGLSVAIADQGVTLAEASDPPACDAGAPTVAAGIAHSLELQLGDAAREPGEALQVSHFATAGKLERQFSFVSAEQPPGVAVTWTAPAEAGAVKQYVVVRDGRGGLSWATWNLCVR
jgi:hypothetical protein